MVYGQPTLNTVLGKGKMGPIFASERFLSLIWRPHPEFLVCAWYSRMTMDFKIFFSKLNPIFLFFYMSSLCLMLIACTIKNFRKLIFNIFTQSKATMSKQNLTENMHENIANYSIWKKGLVGFGFSSVYFTHCFVNLHISPAQCSCIWI